MFLAGHAEHVHMFIRGATLARGMSHYLADRVASLAEPHALHTRMELTALDGSASRARALPWCRRHRRKHDGVTCSFSSALNLIQAGWINTRCRSTAAASY